MTGPHLQPCRGLWGTAEIRDRLPRIETVTDATYFPHRPDKPWGVYDTERRTIIDASVDYRGPERASRSQDTSWRTDAPPAQDAPEEEYIYLGCINFHFGHFITDTLPRFWPLLWGRRTLPRLLCHAPAGHEAWSQFSFLTAILGALGLRPEDVVVFDRPMRIRRLTVPSTALQEQTFGHRAFLDLCQSIGRTFWRPDEIGTDPRPAYVSKTRLPMGVGRFTNESEIVAILEGSGVEIIYPEQLRFADQIRLLTRRRTVMGTLGSAFHATAFAAPGRRIIALNGNELVNSNYAIIDRLTGADATYVYDPDRVHSTEGTFLTEFRLSRPDLAARDLLELAARDPNSGERVSS